MSSMSTKSLWVRIGKSQYLQMDNRELQALVKQRDTHAFCVLYDRHKELIYNYYQAFYGSQKRAQKEVIELFLSAYREKLDCQNDVYLKWLFSLEAKRHVSLSKPAADSARLREDDFYQLANECDFDSFHEAIEGVAPLRRCVLLVWVLKDFSDESSAALFNLSTAQWRRELAWAIEEWIESSGREAVFAGQQMTNAQRRSKLQKSLSSVFDYEIDFIFWSRFEKECEAKSLCAKWWAPALLGALFSLIFLSAYFKEELPGQGQQERGAFHMKKSLKKSAEPASGD